jgi:hypothetical protein
MGACGHEHARRADPALRAARLEECLLQWVENRSLGRLRSEALDRGDPCAVDLADGHEARIDRSAVDQDRAGAALALAAALLRAG